MIRSTEAVSEVLGMMLLLSTMMLIIGIIMLVGMPMIESARNTAKMDVVMNSFLSMQNDIEEVVRGPIWVIDPINITEIKKIGPARETEFELMGGTLTELPGDANVTCSANSGEITVNISTGWVEYESKDEFIVYENGAVIRKYDIGTPFMVSDPLISIYDNENGSTVISIHAISLKGTLSSNAGEGKSWVETRLKYYNQTIESTSSPNSNQLNLVIFSKYPDVWKEFFDQKLNMAGLTPSNQGNTTGYYISGTMPLEVEIYGTNDDQDDEDILLSVYDSGIDLDIR